MSFHSDVALAAVLSSRNAHKARELERLLPGWTLTPLDRGDYPPETGETYYDNALIKARFGREYADGWVLAEDSTADVDLNGVMTGDGRLVEVQATAERDPFSRDQLDELLELAALGIGQIGDEQLRAAEAVPG